MSDSDAISQLLSLQVWDDCLFMCIFVAIRLISGGRSQYITGRIKNLPTNRREMKLSATLTFLVILAAFFTATTSASERVEGWASCSSIISADDYDLTGGNNGSVIVLRNDGTDMRQAIFNAVTSHDVIVFDGIKGDFVFPANVGFQSLSGKTLIGVNGARLCTAFTVTQPITHLLDSLNVKSLSQHAADSLGGTLSNGIYVAEQCELTIRQAIIDRFGDAKEQYRNSGVFVFNGCSNIIVRNLDFIGPGALDVGGADLLTLNGCDHVWVDHCRFTDGMDGNLDIVNNSDFITVSDTHFRYTDKTYNHPLSCLNSGIEITDGSPQKNNISWIRCYWGEGCMGRMPLSTCGIHHLLNCYWDCEKATCIDAHNLSKVLIEKSYFTSRVGRTIAVRDDNVTFEWRGSVWQNKVAPQGNAKIEVPYTYDAEDVSAVPALMQSVGPTLAEPFTRVLSVYPPVIDFGETYTDIELRSRFNLSSFGSGIQGSVTITAPEGVLLSLNQDGEYTSTLVVDAVDGDLLQADVYLKACLSHSGETCMSIAVSGQGRTFDIPVKATALAIEGERSDVSLRWPLDNTSADAVEASVSRPGLFSDVTLRMGEKIYINSVRKTDGSHVLTLFNPTEDVGKIADEECCINFDITPSPGYIFVPISLKLDASRIGTDMCLIDIESCRSGESPRRLLTGFQPARSSDTPSCSEVEVPLDGRGTESSVRITVNLYNMLANKQLALGNVRVEGFVYAVSSGIDRVLPDDNAVTAEYYDMTGRRIMHPQSGMLYLRHNAPGSTALIVYP